MASSEPGIFDMRKLSVFGGAVAMFVAPAIAWGVMSSRIEDHAKRIEQLEQQARVASELLFRIDENVKDLKARRTP